MKFKTGLVSISFRALQPDEILKLVKDSGLEAIEWGGDVHAVAGNLPLAKQIAGATRALGLRMPEYGSYYRIGFSEPAHFEEVLASARVLGTPIIRVWAGKKSPSLVTPEEYEAIVADARRICLMAPDMTICLECHNNTLTEDYETALRFLRDVDCANFQMFWQPNQRQDHQYNLDALRALLPYVHSVHVFSWEGSDKLPLAALTDRWMEYLRILRNSPREEIFLMLEFMHDNDPASLPDAAATLNGWRKALQNEL